MYGKYFHAITKHAAEQYRIISGRASNTEQEERTFNYLKSVSTLTSNHHAENVILNAIVRSQAHELLNDGSHIRDKEKYIEKLFAPLKKQQKESLFTYEWIKKQTNMTKYTQ